MYYMVDFILLLYFWFIVGGFIIYRFVVGLMFRDIRKRLYLRAWLNDWIFLLGAVVISLGILQALPLRVAFLFAKPRMDQEIGRIGPDLRPPSMVAFKAGIYTIAGGMTQQRYNNYGSQAQNDVVFVLADDPESAFIYSEDGIDDLMYNSGDKGHLWGNWYWMTDD